MPATLTELLQSALKALRLGDMATAERLASEVLRQMPREFHALHLLGIIKARQRNFLEADRLMVKALAIRAEPEALKNHAGVLNELGRYEAAIASLKRALKMKPGYADAYFNLGNTLRKTGRLGEALSAFGTAIELRPDYVEALQNQSDTLRDLNRQEEAIAALRRAIELSGRNAELHNNLGIVLRDVGEVDEARTMFERAVALDPGFSAAYYNLARSGKVRSPALLAAMEAALPLSEKQPLNDRARLHFALAKAYEDGGRYDEAFAQLDIGNRMTRSLLDYDEKAEEREVEQIRETFSAALLLEKVGFGDPSILPIFIVGFPRSGTTLTEQILASHPAVHGGGETDALRDLIARPSAGSATSPFVFPASVTALDGDALRRLGAAYVRQFEGLDSGIARVTNKNLGNISLVGFIHLILPNARIVHVRRDPLDTCFSCFALKFGENAVKFSYELGELGRAYRRYLRMMAHWREVLPPGVMLEIEYESLVDDLEAEARRLVEHSGLDWDERCLAFHESARAVRTASVSQVRQPIYRSSIQRWRNYEKHLGPLLMALREAGTE
jgi:tetratricopeptide (TPR) repeat protein